MDAPTAEQEKERGAGRLVSLDAFRGLTIAGMILVNNPGTWGAIYDPLEHAEWHGWTPTDFVFPFFLFIVGVSITLALARRAESAGGNRDLYVKILRRSLIIFALGLFLGGFPFDNLAAIRIPGVLQRIAVCYLLASLVFLKTNWRTQGVVAAALLVGYWALTTFVAAPGFAAGDLSMGGSLASYVDRKLLAGHTWKPLYDPEGVLSTLPALATTLGGVLTGHLLRSRQTPVEKVAAMFVAGAAGVAVGWAWDHWFPINKALWTSSFVVFTAGMALQLLAVCYWLIDIKGRRRWATPFVVFGSNALALYFLAELFSRLISVVTLARADGSRADLKTLIFDNVFAPLAPPECASLMFALCNVLLWLGVMTILYRRRIFIKV